MKKTILFVMMLICLGFGASAESFSGKWEGKLQLGAAQLRIVFNITEMADGTLEATMDSPDQGATGIPCEATRGVGYYKIDIKIPVINGSYSGTLNNNQIEGTFSQNGFDLPLTLSCVEYNNGGIIAQLKDDRDHEVTFGHDDVTLAGTLAMPKGGTKFPAVVLVSGSGTQDRDETIFGHKPFAVISSYLASRGVAVLRYDDRGAGKSSQLKGNETTLDFAADAQAAFDFLIKQKGIDPTRVGYIGHSEGGQIAFINVTNDKRVAFIISLAGPAASGRDVMVQQNLSILDMQGVPYTQAQVDEISGIFDDIVNIADTTQLRESLRKRLSASTLQRYTNEQLEQSVAVMTSPWYMTSIRFNPKPYLEKITCPVLALNGEWDCQVDADQTFKALKASVKNVTCKALPQHNHLFQKCNSKQESMNYATQGDISQATLAEIIDFIKGVY